MDEKQRKRFWDTLCSLNGDDISEDCKRLSETIILPRYLFRYREVTSNNLDALRTNRLYFSLANYYDDPFDTFLHINIEKIRTDFESLFLEDKITYFANEMKIIAEKSNICLPAGFVSFVSDPQKLKELHQNGLSEVFLSYMRELRNEIRKTTWSICFSENGLNENLWLKYANQYKGFALMYDLSIAENLHCGKMDKCKNCGISNFGASLYPMYYSDKPYDTTNYAKYVAVQMASAKMNLQIPKTLMDSLGNMTWEHERTALIKKRCHHYDEEWRIIAGGTMNSPFMMEWVPNGVILGLQMSQSDENLVISCAKQAGIKKIYKSIITEENILDAYLISEAQKQGD